MINVAILGSTGSIGTQSLQVLKALQGYRVYGLSTNQNTKLLLQQINDFHPQMVVVGDETIEDLDKFRGVSIARGETGLCRLAADPKVDIVVNALVGFAGLKPTLAALKAGKMVALANKEVLVTAGHLVMQYAKQIIPIDSEHSAIWQILQGKNRADIESIILTASGGPFFQSKQDLENVTVKEALNHPNWDMGGKISIDSATLMNKGLEVIEAHWLFQLGYDQIEVIIHPQSAIHSMVRFKDGSIIAQMGPIDMRLPIQYALTYPNIKQTVVGHLDLLSLKPLTFFQYDSEKFPCLDLAYKVGKVGGTMPTVLNAANEVAVELFLTEKIKFTQISHIVISAVNRHKPFADPTLEQIFEVDKKTREFAFNIGNQLTGRKD